MTSFDGNIRLASSLKDNFNSIFDGRVTMIRLSELKEGQTAVVERIGGNGALRRRILEMGIVKGSRIKVEKYAPLRDPLELVVKGTHVSLRVEEAARIIVDPLS